jgi:transcription elongation factor Elf1
MSNETQDARPPNPPKPVVCPGCGSDVPAPTTPSKEPLVGYHHCRACGFVFREQTG